MAHSTSPAIVICLVCPSVSISLEPLDRSSQNVLCRFPVAMAQPFSGDVMDDVMFGHNGPYGNVWKAHPQPTTASIVVIPGQSLMSMNALFVLSALEQ